MKSEKTIKKVVSIGVTVLLCVAVVLCLVSVTGALLHDDPSVFGFRCFYVMTGSMEPEISEGALVLTKKNADGVYKVGDVITFTSEDPAILGSSNTHRIVEIRNTNGGVCYVTKGDANPVEDAYTVSPKNIQGRVIAHTGASGWFGDVINFIVSPRGFLLVIVIPLVLVFSSTVKDFMRTYKAELEKLKNSARNPSGEDGSSQNSDDGK